MRSPRNTRNRSAASPIPALMAEFMLERVAANGSVDREVLKLKFSNQQIDEHFEAAKEIADEKAPH